MHCPHYVWIEEVSGSSIIPIMTHMLKSTNNYLQSEENIMPGTYFKTVNILQIISSVISVIMLLSLSFGTTAQTFTHIYPSRAQWSWISMATQY